MEKHILVVEDSPTQLLMLRGVLEEARYFVVGVLDGLKALEHLKTEVPLLVISDVTMPEMDGYTLCRTIRGDQQFENLPILLLTGLSNEEEVLRGLEAGADAFITKPFDCEKLLERVSDLIESSKKAEKNNSGNDSDIIFAGKKYHIQANRSRILRYLISTYDSALQLNARLVSSEEKLQNMNTVLEDRVRTGDADLTIEVQQRKSAQADIQVSKDEVHEARESTEYAESIIDTIREPLIALDGDLRVVSVSRSFYDVFKTNPGETVGQLIYDLGNKQWDIPKLRELLETILPEKSSFDNYEVEHEFSTIGTRIMLLNARQIQRSLGKEKIILLAIEDITERREMEEAHSRLAAIVESADDAIIVEDLEGIIISWNRGAEVTYGYSAGEIIGESSILIIPPGYVEEYITVRSKIARGESIKHYETKRLKKDGQTIDVSLTLSPVKNSAGVIASASSIARDISERKEIEIGLEKSRRELALIKLTADDASELTESIINTVREPLISLDQNLRVITVSRSFYEVFKVKPEETVGQLIYDLGNKQWNIPQLRELLETIIPRMATFENYEVEHDFANIGRRIMLLNARQIKRVSGKERIILLAIEDITERKEIQNGLERAHQELEQLTVEMKRIAQVKSEFLANMSHELRTPLNSINGFSEVLFDESFGVLNEKQKKYVSNVLTSGKHLLLLINQILDMAKVEAGKMKLSLSHIPIRHILNEIASLIADLVSKKNLEMILEIAEDLPDIEADELKIKEVIYNLLSNAVKFTPEGGRIGMRAGKLSNEIQIEVWDTGVGIAAENMDKIFEGFFRVDTPYSRLTEGTGLGLPLSKKMVELHGGVFSIKSEGLELGTCVTFTLPIVSAKED